MGPTMISVCIACGSPRIMYFRKDSDWGSGGDLTRINDDSLYLPDDPDFGDSIDVTVVVCLACGGPNVTRQENENDE